MTERENRLESAARMERAERVMNAERHDLPAMRSVTATRYVSPFREGGSLPGLIEADDVESPDTETHGAEALREHLVLRGGLLDHRVRQGLVKARRDLVERVPVLTLSL